MHGQCRVVWLNNHFANLFRVIISANTAYCRTLGEGTTENEHIILSGYSSYILLISNVPMPEPVPPPNECAN